MTKTTKAKNAGAAINATPLTKNQQVIDLLSRDNGASLEEMANLASWLPHSTSAFMTGLKKRGYAITSDKTGGVRRYRAKSSLAEHGTK